MRSIPSPGCQQEITKLLYLSDEDQTILTKPVCFHPTPAIPICAQLLCLWLGADSHGGNRQGLLGLATGLVHSFSPLSARWHTLLGLGGVGGSHGSNGLGVVEGVDVDLVKQR